MPAASSHIRRNVPWRSDSAGNRCAGGGISRSGRKPSGAMFDRQRQANVGCRDLHDKPEGFRSAVRYSSGVIFPALHRQCLPQS